MKIERQIFEALAIVSVMVTACTGGDDDDTTDRDTGVVMDTGTDAGLIKDTGTSTDAGVAPDTGVDAGMMLEACQPALSASPLAVSVLPFDLVTIAASGGTGDYRFELTQNESGAIVNNLSGAYLSGDVQGATDVITVTDVGCIGETTVTITVVPEMIVRPTNVEAAPGTAWTFEVEGGSGSFTFSMEQAGSGGTVDAAGAYVAGATEGRDIVRVVDDNTGRQIEATIDVATAAGLAANPPFLFVAVGEEQELRMNGGSGYVTIEEAVTYVQLNDTTVTGISAGGGTLTLRDRFTNQTAPITLDVMAPLDFTPVLAGDSLLGSTLTNIGDKNGDGFDDAIFAHPEANVDAYNGGAIYVYAGNATGFDLSPVQTIAGRERDDWLGWDAMTADINGDGNTDLVVGTPLAEAGGGDVGRVEVYYGLPSGWFEDTARTTLTGRFGGDQFGFAVTACDFDDDGDLDIAVGSRYAEDRVRPTRSNNQGAVFVFLQNSTGFSDTGDITLWGDIPDGSGGWIGQTNMAHGTALDAGDFDGDGVCDLAVGSYIYKAPGSGAADGAAFIYKGVAGDGVLDRPAFGWNADDPTNRGAEFGRRVKLGDLDGDGMDELVVGEWRHDTGSSDQHGAVRVYRGRAMTSTPMTDFTASVPSDFDVVGNAGFDYYGWRVKLADVDMDARLDLVVTGPGDEIPGGPGAAGVVHVYLGRPNDLPDPTAPSLTFSGLSNSDQLGRSVAVVDDRDGDGLNDLLAYASYTDNVGRDYGSAYLIRTGDLSLEELDTPQVAAGMRHGWAGDIVGDVNGDGFEDLLVGAPYHASTTRGLRVGAAYLYLGSANGFGTTPALSLDAHVRLSGSDYTGWDVSRAGDFDGDGRPDFAILARFEDQSATYDAGTYAPEAACNGTRNNTGAVFIFRGANGLPSSEPSFIYYGPEVNQGMRRLEGGFNYDGDLYDDLAVGSLDWDKPGASNVGGVAFVRGRPADPGGLISVICSSDFVFEGQVANDYVGREIAAMGDIDGDGCDEVAVGAPLVDLGDNNQGAVYVFFGWGGAGCPAAAEMTRLRSGIRNSQSATAIASGTDLDGDGTTDLAVGMPFFAFNGNTVGAAMVIYGDYIAGLPREPAQDVTPATTDNLFFDTVTPGRPVAIAVGTQAGEQMGRSVAMVSVAGATALMAGSPFGDGTGKELSGGVRGFLFVPGTGLIQEPAALFGGEGSRVGGRVGFTITSGMLDGAPVVLVGGYWGSSLGLDTGSAYVMDFR